MSIIKMPLNNRVRPKRLHCDAYVLLDGKGRYLILEWSSSAISTNPRPRKLIAKDGYLVSNTLIPVWDADAILGEREYWIPRNTEVFKRIHTTVLNEVTDERARSIGHTDVTLLCHYLPVTDAEPLTGVNNYHPPAPFPRGKRGKYKRTLKHPGLDQVNTLPDIL